MKAMQRSLLTRSDAGGGEERPAVGGLQAYKVKESRRREES